MALVYGVLGALLVIFLLAIVTVRKPKFGFGLSVVTLVLITLAVFFYSSEDSRLESQRSRIPVEEIVFTQIKSKLSYGNTYRISGHIENNSSRYMLASIMLDIYVYDCSEKNTSQNPHETIRVGEKNCRLLQRKQHKVDTRMLPETSKSIETYVLLDALNGNDSNLEWDIRVLSGIGR